MSNAVKTKKPILDKVASTWGKLEPTLLGLVAAKLPVACRGTHGNAKTTIAKMLARALVDKDFLERTKDTGVRYYSCDKANYIALGGIPDIEGSKTLGSMAFIPSKSSVIGPNAKVLILDELTRAPKDTQNYLLEIIESRTFSGVELSWEALIATMNPETYKSAMKLDAALLDRFAALLPINSLEDVDAPTLNEMIQTNMSRTTNPLYDAEIADVLRERITNTRAQYQKFLEDEEVLERVRGYYEQFCSYAQSKLTALKDPTQILSGREMANLLWRSCLAIAAYYVAVQGHTEGEALCTASDNVLEYSIILKHQIQSEMEKTLRVGHREAQYMLRASTKGEAGKIQMAFARAGNTFAKIDFWRSNIDKVVQHIAVDDATTMIEATLDKLNNLKEEDSKRTDTDIMRMRAELWSILKPHTSFAPVTDRVEGGIVCQLISTLRKAHVNPMNEPFKTVFAKATLKASDISDLIVSLTKDK